jgi:hypothetical protein
MLPSFDPLALTLPTALIFAAVLVAALRCGCPPAIGWALATAKAGLYFVYYGALFDGRFTFSDDWTYLERGGALYDAGVGVTNLLDSLPLLLAAGEGDHFLYYLLNALAIGWFGDGYYAPVAFNVIAAVAVAWLGTRLLVAEHLCRRAQAPLLFTFLVLHPDITAWSTVMNGKDTLVLLLHVLLLTAVSWFLRGLRWRAIVLAAAATVVLTFLRFYVPLLFGVALAVVGLTSLRGAARWRLSAAALLLLAATAWQLGPEGVAFVLDRLRSELTNPVVGFTHFLLTPIPFNTSANYAFLDLPALLHWLLMPTVALGLWTLHRRSTPFARFLLAYIAVFATLYAVYGELQGPRHRVQLDFAWATLQFVGLGVALRLLAWRATSRQVSYAQHTTAREPAA